MDPNPIKHIGALMKRVRSAIEPAIISAGFVFDGRNKQVRRNNNPMWFDYSRPDKLLRISYEQNIAQLAAEIVDANEGHRIVVTTNMNRPESTSQLMDRIDTFASEVSDFIGSLPPISSL